MADYHSAAIKTDGTLWLWGCGASGRLGNNSTTDHSSPVQTVSTGTNWKQVSMGYTHSASIKTDGTLWLWGCNVAGNLGNNSTVDQSSPVQTVVSGTNWKQVGAGGQGNSAAVTFREF
jgi:alpha-tubulin suppressor-like RCC1 family protein